MKDFLKLIALTEHRMKRNHLFVVHIDDCLEVARTFRQYGYTLKRGRYPDGSKAQYFQIHYKGALEAMLAVNKNLPRGEVYTFNEPETFWNMERIKVDFEFDTTFRMNSSFDNSSFDNRSLYQGVFINPTI